jgi:hypothetical protein
MQEPGASTGLCRTGRSFTSKWTWFLQFVCPRRCPALTGSSGPGLKAVTLSLVMCA